eukprot:s247_g7.t4
MGCEHRLEWRKGQWQLEVPVSSDDTKALSVDVAPGEVRIGGLDKELCISVPEHAPVDVERCVTKLRHGRLVLTWPLAPQGCERECLVVKKSSEPLLFVCHDFLDKRTCADIIHAAKSFGKATPVCGEDVKYEMPLWPEEHPGLDPGVCRQLELIYRRLDLLCGTPRRPDEQPPRVHFQAPHGAVSQRMLSGLHLDTNGAPHRFVTALVYLDTLPQPQGDGATVFPCAHGEPPEVHPSESVQKAGEVLWREGVQELMGGAQRQQGLSVYPECGKLALFFTRGDAGDVDPMSWHGGARVGAAGEHGGKWMLQLFKTVPPELRGRKELIARFSERCRQLPDFSLGGVCHRQVPGRPVSAADRTAESGKCEPPAGVTGDGKFWEIVQEGQKTISAFGKLGSTGRTDSQVHYELDAATRCALDSWSRSIPMTSWRAPSLMQKISVQMAWLTSVKPRRLAKPGKTSKATSSIVVTSMATPPITSWRLVRKLG